MARWDWSTPMLNPTEPPRRFWLSMLALENPHTATPTPLLQEPDTATGGVWLEWDASGVKVYPSSRAKGNRAHVPSDYLQAVAYAHQAWENHPSRHGLVGWGPWKEFIPYQTPLRLHDWAIPASSVLVPSSSYYVGAHAGVGWFLPDADPDELHQPYLAPVIAGESGDVCEMQWVAAITGSCGTLGVARWDDGDAVSSLIRALSDPARIEAAVVESALIETEMEQNARRRHERSISEIKCSRDFAFAHAEVPSPLIEAALIPAWTSWRAMKGIRERYPTRHIFGFPMSLPNSLLGATSELKSTAIAYFVDLRMSHWDADHTGALASFGSYLALVTQEKELGSVVTVSLPATNANPARTQLFITRRPDLFTRYAAVLDIPSDATITAVEPSVMRLR